MLQRIKILVFWSVDNCVTLNGSFNKQISPIKCPFFAKKQRRNYWLQIMSTKQSTQNEFNWFVQKVHDNFIHAIATKLCATLFQLRWVRILHWTSHAHVIENIYLACAWDVLSTQLRTFIIHNVQEVSCSSLSNQYSLHFKISRWISVAPMIIF